MPIELVLEMPDSISEFEKCKTSIASVGLPKILIVTFSYFFMVYLIPLVLLTIIVDVSKITVGTYVFYGVVLVLFIGYFVQDLYLLTSEKFTFTIAVMLAVIQLVNLVAKVINGNIQLLTVDEETPQKIRMSVFPLNCV